MPPLPVVPPVAAKPPAAPAASPADNKGNKGAIVSLGRVKIGWKREEGGRVIFPTQLVLLLIQADPSPLNPPPASAEDLVLPLEFSQKMTNSYGVSWVTADGMLKLICLHGSRSLQVRSALTLSSFLAGPPFSPPLSLPPPSLRNLEISLSSLAISYFFSKFGVSWGVAWGPRSPFAPRFSRKPRGS